MRIQETDKVLKEARFTRHNTAVHDGGRGISRGWRSLSSIPGLVAVAAAAAAVAAVIARRSR